MTLRNFRIFLAFALVLVTTLVASALQRGAGTFGGNRGAGGFGGAQQTPTQVVLPAGPGSIEGVVRRADDKTPIAAAEITVAAQVTGGTQQVNTVTDASGRFSFRNIAITNYAIRARHDGFFGVVANGSTSPAQNTQVRLTATQPDATLEILLTPGAAITGKIMDPDGRPTANVRVTPMRRRYQDGDLIITTAGQGVTDVSGQYRVPGLEPGEYFVRAVVAQNAAALTPQTVTYFPSSPDVFGASTVVANPGSEVVVDVQLMRGVLRKVAGRIVGQSTNANPRFLLVPQGKRTVLDNLELSAPATTRGPNGEFEIQTMRPGRYDLFVSNAASESARASVDLRDQDVTGLTLSLNPSFTLDVRVVGDGISQGQLPTGLSLVSLDTPLPPGLRPAQAGGLGARGQTSQTFNNVAQGRYVLSATAQTRAISNYVSDIQQNGRSLLNDGIIAVGPEKPAPVDVLIGTSGGEIRGSVQGGVAGQVNIVAIPDGSRRQNLLLYSRMPARGAGASMFRMTGLTPGRYKVFAFEDLPVGAEQNVEFMKPYDSMGTTVEVTRGALTPDVVLTLIRRDP